VDSRQHEVRVVVGLDGLDGVNGTMPAMPDMVLVGAPAHFGTESIGTVAVIAPTRMQYQEMIQAVSYIARLSERVSSDRVLSERAFDSPPQ